MNKINIAIDFGMTNTLVAVFHEEVEILTLPGISHKLGSIDVVPSIIGYSNDNGKIVKHIGLEAAQLPDANVVKRMKRLATSTRYKKVNGKDISYYQVTMDFLNILVSSLRYRYLHADFDEVVFTVPVDSYDTYRALIDELCDVSGIYKYHILDESTATALGYENIISADHPYMIIDFGGGTLDVSIVKLTRIDMDFTVKVLGKSGTNLGGSDIDDWLLEDFIKNQGMTELVNHYEQNDSLLEAIETIKIELCTTGKAEINFCDEAGNFVLNDHYDIARFNQLLQMKHFAATIQNTLDNALEIAHENGIRKRDISGVLLVGGSSQIPLFVETILDNFPGKVKNENPYGAVVRGAANYLSGKVVEDFLHHHYAIEYLDVARNVYDFEVIVPEGTKYPAPQIKRLIISLPFTGQKKAALKLFEVSTHVIDGSSLSGVTYDENNMLRVERDSRNNVIHRILLNPDNPEFILLDPPSIKNQDRLEITFSVDKDRMLHVTVFDLICNTQLIDDKIVARLK
jgi:molecular chaperone DnaK (HSP70)